jgi:hypothetical protein
MLIMESTSRTNQAIPNDAIEAAVISGKAFLRKSFRFIQKVRDLNRDPFASYWKFKVLKGLKQPACKWSDRRNHQKTPIDNSSYNTGIPTGSINNLLVVDIDVKNGGLKEYRKYIKLFGHIPTLTVRTPSGGLHLYFNYSSSNPQDAEKIIQHLRNKTGFRGGKGIDIRSEGGYIVAPPSAVSKKPYEIIQQCAIIDIPGNLIDWLLEKDPKVTSAKRVVAKGEGAFAKREKAFASDVLDVKPASEKELEDIKNLCSCLSINQLDNYSIWIRIGMVLKKLGAPLSFWEEVSQKSKKYKNNDCSSKWCGFNPEHLTIGSLFVLAKGQFGSIR